MRETKKMSDDCRVSTADAKELIKKQKALRGKGRPSSVPTTAPRVAPPDVAPSRRAAPPTALYPTPFGSEEMPNLAAPDAAFLDLSFFEARRLEIAKACAEAINTDVSEFAFTQETFQFHFMSQLIAVGEWVGDRLIDTSWVGLDDSAEDWRDGDARWTHQALAQLLAGLFARLLLHPVSMGAVQPGSPEAALLDAFSRVALSACSENQARPRSVGISAVLICWSLATQGLMRGVRLYCENGGDLIGARLDELEAVEPHLLDAIFGGGRDDPFPFDAVRNACGMLWAEARHVMESGKNGPLTVSLQLNPAASDVQNLATFKRFVGLYGFHRRPMELLRDRETGALSLIPFHGRFTEIAQGAGTPQSRFVMEACRTQTIGRWKQGDAVDLLVFQASFGDGLDSHWNSTVTVIHALGDFTRQQENAGHKPNIVFYGQALL